MSTIRRHTSDQALLVTPEPPIGSRIFDPDIWPWRCTPEATTSALESSELSPATLEASDSSATSTDAENNVKKSAKSKKKEEIIEENRSDGHAPIKSAASILMHSLQKSSSMTTSLSDIDVTLFNFHSIKFAERLLNRNVSGVVIVESSHVFSKNAKI
uniref:Uncharacterized protein n=1 Tax=Caenorhabditis japonica TaxID=281687 RepID=A0A8R1HL27_CAEJA